MFKIFTISILSLFSIATIILIMSLINHKIQLKKEALKYFPASSIIEVNGRNLHIYSEGEGDVTIVFMSGHGTSSPTLDFKPLWRKMADDYRIVVVEKFGYGWSDVSSSPRDIKTVLEETREALDLSGEKGPFILFPHSMSGLEAIYWAQTHPHEVNAIVGLDPCIPDVIDLIPKPKKVQLNFMYFISRFGLTRLMPESEVGENLPLMRLSELSEEDRKQYLAIFYRSAFTKDMLREVSFLEDNAKAVINNEVPADTPMLFFISDEQEKTIKGWKEALTNYLKKITRGNYIQLTASHYVHYGKSAIIAESAKKFLANTK